MDNSHLLEKIFVLGRTVALKEVVDPELGTDLEVDIDPEVCTDLEVCTILVVDIVLEVCKILQLAPQAVNYYLEVQGQEYVQTSCKCVPHSKFQYVIHLDQMMI